MSKSPQDIFDVMDHLDPVDAGLLEMLPEQVASFLRLLPDISRSLRSELAASQARVASLTQQLSDLDAGIREYADQTGQGQLLLDNLRLCLDQVRNRKQQGLGI